MKVLLVTQEYPPFGSGIANAVCELQKTLIEQGFQAYTLSNRGADINVQSTFQFFPGMSGTIPVWINLAKYVSKIANEFDLVWLHSPIILNGEKLRNVKRMMISMHTTYYGFYHACRRSNMKRYLPYYYVASKFERHFFKQISKNDRAIFTAVSPSVAEEAHQNGVSRFPYVVPNGVSKNFKSSLDKQSARKILEKLTSICFSENDKLFLFVGRLTDVKQSRLLVSLFERITLTKPNYHLILIGSGNLFGRIRSRFRKKSNIHTLGYFSHRYLPIPLKAADAFISLSCYEGLPLAVLEAASFNLPLILSNIPAHKWILDAGAGHGILVNPCSFTHEEIVSFIDCLDKCKYAPRTLKEQFSWSSIVEKYMQLFNDFSNTK
jgi:glycosyltransferase involved in cell wall biosynthesis